MATSDARSADARCDRSRSLTVTFQRESGEAGHRAQGRLGTKREAEEKMQQESVLGLGYHRQTMAERQIQYRIHALERMAEREISTADVRSVLDHGEPIEEYPGDYPYPSRLMLAVVGGRPLHVVAAEAAEENLVIIVTVYEPHRAQWDSTFRRRTTP